MNSKFLLLCIAIGAYRQKRKALGIKGWSDMDSLLLVLFMSFLIGYAVWPSIQKLITSY